MTISNFAELTPLPDGALRAALSRYVTGVTIVTCLDEQGAPVGLTANSFNALSLEPPLVLWSLRTVSPSVESFVKATHFAVNVLSRTQIELSRRFASSIPDKFLEGQWSTGHGGVPVLEGCVAVFECEQVSSQDAGDHVLFIGRVQRVTSAALEPLVFHARHYHQLGPVL